MSTSDGMVTSLSLLLLLSLLITKCECYVSTINYKPFGTNPLLYEPEQDPIAQLDAFTFNDTVFGQNHAVVVEFYADWCGHCRAFAPIYRQLAEELQAWHSIVILAAINCADPMNQQTCAEQNIYGYPMIKYYPRNAHTPSQALALDTTTQNSAEFMKSQIARTIVNEYNIYQYNDWPQFQYLQVFRDTKFDDLWDGVSPQASYLVIVFEQYDSVGNRLILDLWSYKEMLGVKRALSTSPLVPMLYIKTFPYIALFKRNQQRAVYMDPYTPQTVENIKRIVMPQFLMNNAVNTNETLLTSPHPIVTPAPLIIINCEQKPDKCRELYFVSETDMLKAMRMALMDEVMKSGKVISNENFTALYNFIGVLSEHFPTYSFSNNLQRQHRSRRSQSVLRMSTRARHVFIHMREFLNKHLPQMQVNASDWQQHFVNMERVFGNPFPTNASWVHCKGTRPQYRGYTCGLWTTFHALTVNAYMNSLERELQPLQILSSIKQWVDSFFGCLHCRQHFDRMTTKIFPMTERWIRQPSDMMMYLWRAHNIVNQRLHNDPTEDPQFEKYQFPAPFLCQSCQIGSDHFSKKEVHRFLMRFYGNIRAYQPDAQT